MAENYSIIGFSFQKMICNKYSIVPTSNKLQNLFESLELLEDESLISIINKIFNEINLKPEYCTTLTVDESNSAVPHNFILENNSTLSIRTNKKGTKVAPRIIGQAGYSVLNLYFKNIYGKEIKTQKDIKNLIINKIDKCLPIFFEKLMDADYIVWIYKNKDNLNAKVLMGLGGSLDVFAGEVKRAPQVYQKLNIEWLYRLCKEPKRIGRMMDLPKFAFTVVTKGKREEK